MAEEATDEPCPVCSDTGYVPDRYDEPCLKCPKGREEDAAKEAYLDAKFYHEDR